VSAGHGVGAGLNVHEGPQSISTRYYIDTPLAAGMVCSNEPGYYEDGKFGVRIENLVVVEEKDTEYRWVWAGRMLRCSHSTGLCRKCVWEEGAYNSTNVNDFE
jgi:Xaa-Pro aminopeptidase